MYGMEICTRQQFFDLILYSILQISQARASHGSRLPLTHSVGHTLADLCSVKPCTVLYNPVWSCMVQYMVSYDLLWSPRVAYSPLKCYIVQYSHV